MKKQKMYLDMDGTIADLYGMNDWLKRLRNEDYKIFLEAKAVITEEQLLKEYPLDKYEIVILSMTPKNATDEFIANVKYAKDKWLDEHFPSLVKRIYMKYGGNKNLAHCHNAILIDDNEAIRNKWNGIAVVPQWGATTL